MSDWQQQEAEERARRAQRDAEIAAERLRDDERRARREEELAWHQRENNRRISEDYQRHRDDLWYAARERERREEEESRSDPFHHLRRRAEPIDFRDLFRVVLLVGAIAWLPAALKAVVALVAHALTIVAPFIPFARNAAIAVGVLTIALIAARGIARHQYRVRAHEAQRREAERRKREQDDREVARIAVAFMSGKIGDVLRQESRFSREDPRL